MAAAESALIHVEVVYALPSEQVLVALDLPAGATVGEAVRRSGLLERYAVGDAPVGVFGRVADGATRLRDGDRVEIYRPLTADPKTARRRRAARKR